MKEFMYATALCLLMMAIWCFSRIPSDASIEAVRSSDPELALNMRKEQHELRLISGTALGLSLVLGVIGWRSKSREESARKQLD